MIGLLVQEPQPAGRITGADLRSIARAAFFARSRITPRRVLTATGAFEELPLLYFQAVVRDSLLPQITEACALATYGIRHDWEAARSPCAVLYFMLAQQVLRRAEDAVPGTDLHERLVPRAHKFGLGRTRDLRTSGPSYIFPAHIMLRYRMPSIAPRKHAVTPTPNALCPSGSLLLSLKAFRRHACSPAP